MVVGVFGAIIILILQESVKSMLVVSVDGTEDLTALTALKQTAIQRIMKLMQAVGVLQLLP